MKPLNLMSSIFFTIATLVGGAVFASSIAPKEVRSSASVSSTHIKTASSQIKVPKRQCLSVTLNNIRSGQGKLVIMAFDNELAFADFDYQKAAGYKEAKPSAKSLSIEFPMLCDGSYAVFAMHDENEDYVLNEEGGYPLEGFAVSGSVSPYDYPKFEEAQTAAGKLYLELVYF